MFLACRSFIDIIDGYAGIIIPEVAPSRSIEVAEGPRCAIVGAGVMYGGMPPLIMLIPPMLIIVPCEGGIIGRVMPGYPPNSDTPPGPTPTPIALPAGERSGEPPTGR